MAECFAHIEMAAWISGVGSFASIVALGLALWEWHRVKTVRQELEEQRHYFSKLHFLTEDLRQLREHRGKLQNHRANKRWEQTGTQMRSCLGNLEAMRPRLDEGARNSHSSLVSKLRAVLEELQTSDDPLLATAVMDVLGHLDHFIAVVDNTLEEHYWRREP